MTTPAHLTYMNLRTIASLCREKLTTAEQRDTALKNVAFSITQKIGDAFSPEILDSPDEISVGFIELLDSIIFDMEDNYSADDRIRGYIVDDLYKRLGIYLDIYDSIDTYKKNLRRRLLIEEDIPIIKHYCMEEFVPLLIAEYHEIPALQIPILRALISFRSEDLLNFFYEIARSNAGLELKVISLIGLKGVGSRFTYWRLLKTENQDYNAFIDYVQNYDISALPVNSIPGDDLPLLFLLYIYEDNREKKSDIESFTRLLTVLEDLSSLRIDASLVSPLFRSLSNIIFFMDIDIIRETCALEENAERLFHIINAMPREFFDKISLKLAHMGDQFRAQSERFITMDEDSSLESNAHILRYLMAEQEPIL